MIHLNPFLLNQRHLFTYLNFMECLLDIGNQGCLIHFELQENIENSAVSADSYIAPKSFFPNVVVSQLSLKWFLDSVPFQTLMNVSEKLIIVTQTLLVPIILVLSHVPVTQGILEMGHLAQVSAFLERWFRMRKLVYLNSLVID